MIYKNVLGRDEVDQEGLDYWSASLASGAQTRGTLINTILGSAHGFKGHLQYGYVADLLDNKVTVGNYFAIEQGLNYLTPEDSISKGIKIAAAVTATDTAASKLLIAMSDKQLDLKSSFPGINSVSVKALALLPNAVTISTSTVILPSAPLNLAAAPSGSNFKIWIYDPRNTSVKFGSPGIFLAAGGGGYTLYNAGADGTVSVKVGPGVLKFDVLEPNGTGATFTRKSYLGVVASAGAATPSAEAPSVPNNLSTAPAGSNFKIWIYDPRSPSVALPSSIFILSPAGVWGPEIKRTADASINLSLEPGQYQMDVAEPDPGLFKRRRYTMSVSASGGVTVDGVTPNPQGIFPLTVHLQDLPGALSIKGLTPNANGVYAVTAETIVPVAPSVQLLRDNLISSAKTSALDFKPTSACQLIDQVTTVRTINGPDISAGFPRVNWRLPSTGRIRALIVPIDFDDVVGVDNVRSYVEPITNQIRDFYLKQSYGRLTTDFEVTPNWIRAPFPVSDYYGSTPQSSNPGAYADEIIKLTDALIDYAQYDAVFFIVPKQMTEAKMAGAVGITRLILTRNGYIANGAIMAALAPHEAGNEWKVMSHEMGHGFGLYDEDLEHSSQSLGSWGIMADSWSKVALEHHGWDRYLLGWLSESQTACLPRSTLTASGITVKLDPLVRQNTETKVAMVPLSASKILVMESRKNEGYDHLESGREGVLVYTVDMKLGQLKGGYQTQRRLGSTDPWFHDAALRTGDSLTIDGVTVTVMELNTAGDTIKISVK